MITTMKTTSAVEKDNALKTFVEGMTNEQAVKALKAYYGTCEEYLEDKDKRLSLDARYHWLEWTFVIEDWLEHYRAQHAVNA
jgi:hypothetical protein